MKLSGAKEVLVRRTLKEKSKSLGKAVILATVVQNAQATEQLVGDIFIEQAGYTAAVGPFSFQAVAQTKAMEFSYKEPKTQTAVSRQISRVDFTGLLERNEYGEFVVKVEGLTKLLNTVDLDPDILDDTGGFGSPNEVVTVNFDNIQEPNCKLLDKAEVGMRGILDCRKVSKDADKYTKDIEGITALAQKVENKKEKVEVLKAAIEVAEIAKELAK